ncbi:MAG: Ltp family lipoprotein [Streptococcaceae bacterium]|jgi:hypothetical protein|nr:Ltp family lipoprotein [Streptococcaceae bacterium]
MSKDTGAKPKKPFYKKWWFWVIVALAVIIGATSQGKKSSNTTSNSSSTSSSSSSSSKSSASSSVAKTLTGQQEALNGLSGNALAQMKTGISYLKSAHMSKQELYGQLTSENGEKMTADEATAVVNKLDPLVNWNNLAVYQAQSYRESGNLTGQALLDQLTSEYGAKFTPEQAQYGVDNIDTKLNGEYDFWNK